MSSSLRTILPTMALTMALASPGQAQAPSDTAPAASPTARYCLRVEAVTGTRIEKILCLTRAEWSDQDVDVDREWAKEGVRIIG